MVTSVARRVARGRTSKTCARIIKRWGPPAQLVETLINSLRRSRMYLVMKVYSDDDYADGANSCAIELTKANLKEILDKIKLAKGLKKQDNNFSTVDFYYGALWSTESIEDDRNEHEFREEFKESDDLRIDCERLNVSEDHVQVQAYLKNTSVNQNAETLGEDYLKKIYKALTCPKEKLALLVHDEDAVVSGVAKTRCKEGK
jgi:hypothetical protein